MKEKGSRAERELLHKFFDIGWICVRAAGSGSIPLPCPDLLAGKGGRSLAIECKSTKKLKKYLTKQEVEDLIRFSEMFGAEAIVGLRVDRNGWSFFDAKDLKFTGKFYVADSSKGIKFEELINE
tara:strand:- start:1387 stop:1758 length:372 start_codon:yes stop_codon:yes gene_type:complete